MSHQVRTWLGRPTRTPHVYNLNTVRSLAFYNIKMYNTYIYYLANASHLYIHFIFSNAKIWGGLGRPSLCYGSYGPVYKPKVSLTWSHVRLNNSHTGSGLGSLVIACSDCLSSHHFFRIEMCSQVKKVV